MNGEWEPRTRLGEMIRSGEITTMHEALKTGLPLREPEIVDLLLPNLEDEVLDVNMVQRMTDSGRRVKFSITVVVGNRNGYVGIGQFKGKEVGPSIRKAINNAHGTNSTSRGRTRLTGSSNTLSIINLWLIRTYSTLRTSRSCRTPRIDCRANISDGYPRLTNLSHSAISRAL